MNQSSGNRGIPVGNPLANLLVIIVGGLAIAASIVLGFFAFFVFVGLVLVLAAIIAVRISWARYRLRRSNAGRQESRTDADPQQVIEGEYEVVADDDRADR